jgi:transposase, IS5 family
VRSKVEWPFRILKRVFGFVKVRYRGLKKNHEWLLAAFALVNLYQHSKRLASTAAQCVRRVPSSALCGPKP